MNYRSIEVCARSQTKEMSDGYLVAYGQTPTGEVLPVNGVDMYLYGDANTWSTIQATANTLTINDSLYPAMPEFYRYVYTEVERSAELSTITPEQMVGALHSDYTIKPCVQLQ